MFSYGYLMTNDVLDDILGDIDDNEFNRAIETILAHAGEITADDARQIMDGARVADPTFSGPGAMVRDTLRKHTALPIS